MVSKANGVNVGSRYSQGRVGIFLIDSVFPSIQMREFLIARFRQISSLSLARVNDLAFAVGLPFCLCVGLTSFLGPLAVKCFRLNI